MADLPPPQYVDYPRDTFQPSTEFSRPPGVYFDAFSDAWKLVTRDLGTWIAMVLLGGFIYLLIFGPFWILSVLVQYGGEFDLINPPATSLGSVLAANGVSVVGQVVAFPAYCGLYYAALRQIQGQGISVSDVFKGFSSFIQLVIYFLLFTILTYIGIALCVFPLVFVLGAFSLAPLLIMDRNMTAFQAMRESFRALGSQAWSLGFFIVAAGILVFLSAFCCVGVLVTFPIYIIGVTLHYHYFFPPQPTTYSPPMPAQG